MESIFPSASYVLGSAQVSPFDKGAVVGQAESFTRLRLGTIYGPNGTKSVQF